MTPPFTALAVLAAVGTLSTFAGAQVRARYFPSPPPTRLVPESAPRRSVHDDAPRGLTAPPPFPRLETLDPTQETARAVSGEAGPGVTRLRLASEGAASVREVSRSAGLGRSAETRGGAGFSRNGAGRSTGATPRPVAARRPDAADENAAENGDFFDENALVKGRVFVDEQAGDPVWGFEGPTTRSDDDAFYVMGVRVSMADDALAGTPIPALADARRAHPDSPASPALCGADAACSWSEVHALSSETPPFDRDFARSSLVGDDWFGHQMTDYSVARGTFSGSLPGFVTKMTAGRNDAVHPPALEPVTASSAPGSAFVADSFIFEPRENVLGGTVVEHPSCAGSVAEKWDACLGQYFYTVNEVLVVPSTLRGFPSVAHEEMAARKGRETLLIGHFVRDDDADPTDAFQGLFYVREEEFDPPPPEEPAEPCADEADACEPAPTAEAPVSVFEGPITRLEGPAAGSAVDPWDEANWALMYIMGCPVRVHPDLVLGGPTSEGEPVRGANLLDLLDGVSGRGHALSVFGSTGKGVAERRDVVDRDTGLPQTMYVFREVVVELAENVIIYPDASDAAIETLEDGVETLRLFPDGNGGHQLAARLSSDANFPGRWLDAGGDPLDSLAAALEAAPDKSLGLGGYFSPADDSDGAGETAGTFYVVEGETTAPPAELPAVLVTRYNLRYSAAGEARAEIRGQYVSDVDLDVASPVRISLEMKYAEGGERGDGAFPCAETDGSDCLVASASGDDRTGSPGRILDDDDDAVVDETVDCEADPDFPRQCSFRIRVREDVAVAGLEDWPSYHAPLALQYLEKVFAIRVKADDDEETAAEATPGRVRFD